MRIIRPLLLTCVTVMLLAVRTAAAADAEPGFTLLFNGKDLSGWKTKAGGVPLEGLTESPDQRFKVLDGNLVIDTKVKKDVIIETTRELSGDLHLKFEYQPGQGCNNDLFLRGLKFDLKPNDVKNLKQDEWNQFEIIIIGDKAEFKNNGETQRTSPVKVASSPLGVRAEFGPIQFRRMQVKEEKK